VTARRSFATRLMAALALLLLGYGVLVALLGRHAAVEQEAETLQRLSHGLARHIVAHWPQITRDDRDASDRAAREALLQMLMVVNPGVHVYVLGADGHVAAYIGAPGMVQQPQVDLAPVRAFLAGAPLPLRGTDPMHPAAAPVPRLFSAAMFAPGPGDTRPPGYLYIVLDGAARQQVAAQTSTHHIWQGVAAAAVAGLLATLLAGWLVLRRVSLPLHRLARRMRDYSQRQAAPPVLLAQRQPMQRLGDEVQAMETAFGEMTQRIETQAARELAQTAAHREMMASVAHDLRTPLTALHGHLEMLATGGAPAARLLDAALSQSNKVRRLSQQLFELAALQSSAQVLHRERFSLDELVADAVQKFELTPGLRAVTLAGAPPGRLELDGDLQLIERALSNLIDNAMRHAGGAAPVRVSMQRVGDQVQIVVEDSGPGLPAELALRLARGQPLREPPLRRLSGGIGGLGLAIAQRVAVLHGGSLQPLPAPAGGTRLCLALPMTA
jgi:signal transduction histidine kinase